MNPVICLNAPTPLAALNLCKPPGSGASESFFAEFIIGICSSLQRLRQSQHFRPMQLGHGPVVLHPNNGPFTSHGMGFGHGPVVHRPFNGHAFPALRSGYRPGRQGL